MADRMDRFEAVRTHYETLIEDTTDERDGVLDPSREFDRFDYVAVLEDSLRPQMDLEDRVLYRAVDEAVGSEVATAGFRADHEEIERRIDALETQELDGAALPLLLHEFSALVENHVRKEVDVLLPFLRDELDEAAFESLLESLLEEFEDG